MTDNANIEKRKHPRRLTGLLPGRFVTADHKRDVRMMPLDVSHDGIGCLISEQFAVGAEFLLMIGKEEIKLVVMWATPDMSRQNMFRYGLELRTPNVNLEELFEKTGCLREGGAPPSLTPQSLAAEPVKQVKLYGLKSRKPAKPYRKPTRTRYF